ncbi:MAG TPA: leucine-rich repeat domain-containing protein [Cyclobacteriaceae bacterium]
MIRKILSPLIICLSINCFAQKPHPEILNSVADLETRTDLSEVTWAALYHANLSEFPVGLFKCKNLEHISISDGQILTVPEEIITALPKLNRIELEDCGLTEIPEVFYRLPGLKSLTLDGNKITIVTDRINAMTKLEHFSLANNQIQSIPATINLPKLRSLDLKKNQLKELPDAIYLSKSLDLIHLSNNPIAEISPKIGDLSKLEHLDLSFTQIKSLPATLKDCKKLKSIGIIETPLSSNSSERQKFESETGKKLISSYRL